jgi:hypothetical protein
MRASQPSFWQDFREEFGRRKALQNQPRTSYEQEATTEATTPSVPWVTMLSSMIAFGVVSRFAGPVTGALASNITAYLTNLIRQNRTGPSDLEAGRGARVAGIEMLETTKDSVTVNVPKKAEESNGVLAAPGEKLQVCIVGSGNWGSTAAKIIGENIQSGGEASKKFKEEVRMWVFEEQIEQEDGSMRNLTEIINEERENVKYLKGIKLPSNVKAMPDLKEAATGSKVFVWVLPHQFIPRSAETVKEVLDPNHLHLHGKRRHRRGSGRVEAVFRVD